jgi:hypothetical protein
VHDALQDGVGAGAALGAAATTVVAVSAHPSVPVTTQVDSGAGEARNAATPSFPDSISAAMFDWSVVVAVAMALCAASSAR